MKVYTSFQFSDAFGYVQMSIHVCATWSEVVDSGSF